MKSPSFPFLHVALLTLFSLASAGLAQGPLPPPGPLSDPFADRALDGSGNPVPSMKTLTQTDPGQLMFHPVRPCRRPQWSHGH